VVLRPRAPVPGLAAVKPPAFDYLAARTVPEAVDALAGDPSARVLAGGQSLLLELAYRQVRAGLLVDVNTVAGLDGLDEVDGGLRIGALVRHQALERPPSADPLRLLLAKAAPYVAHPPIRVRGTFCGSLAWAHPAAEWNAVLAGLRGTVELVGPSGPREVPADAWFAGPLLTTRAVGEVVVAARLPALDPGAGTGFAELRRTHASFATVAVAVAVTVADGVVVDARIGLAGVGEVAVAATSAEDAVRGRPVQEAVEAGATAVTDIDPYRRAVTAELLRRSLREALDEAAA
jgi:carbon-monoxide dehydrogenase medium subunit